MGSFEIVPFYDDQLQASRDDAGVWVPIRPVCEALGIDSDGQRRKLLVKPWATTKMILAVAEDGKNRELFCLHLDSLPMWLATIEPARVRPEVRAKLERYQREAAHVLASHFLGEGRERTVQLAPPAAMALIRETAKEIAAPIVGALSKFGERVEEVSNRVDAVEQRVVTLGAAIEHHLKYKRKTPSAEVRRSHIEFARAAQRDCPCCDVPMFDESGRFVGHIHHHDAASNANIDATMPVCAGCNQRFNREPTPRHFVEAYHARRKRFAGPLFSGRRGNA